MTQGNSPNALAGQATRDSVLEQLTALLREVFQDNRLVATADLTADNVRGWDSLGHVRLLVEIETAFSIRFLATEISSLKNVGQLAALIETKIQCVRR